MDRLLIKGGTPLKGEVEVSGAKNAVLPLMAASLLATGTSRLGRVPELRDVRTMARLLEHIGAKCSFEPPRRPPRPRMELDTTGVRHMDAPYDLVKTMRASVLVLGPLVARYGRARVSMPGGCAIGARPVNLHIEGLRRMGAEIEIDRGYVSAKADRLRGATLNLELVTVTGTENLMMAATLAKGTTVIENAAREPEVLDLANALISMGANIRGAGESVIEIEGVDELRPYDHRVIPDRIETGSFIAAAGITGGDILIKDARPEHLDAVVLKLRETGIEIEETAGGLRVKGVERPGPANVTTTPYPGFPTDMQAQFMALASVATGTSVIRETIFENRFMHVPELKRMGADIETNSGTATVRGVKALKGAEVMATDLRASASLVIAALSARGETVLHRIYHLDRGYEALDEKLKGLGAMVQRLK